MLETGPETNLLFRNTQTGRGGVQVWRDINILERKRKLKKEDIYRGGNIWGWCDQERWSLCGQKKLLVSFIKTFSQKYWYKTSSIQILTNIPENFRELINERSKRSAGERVPFKCRWGDKTKSITLTLKDGNFLKHLMKNIISPFNFLVVRSGNWKWTSL